MSLHEILHVFAQIVQVCVFLSPEQPLLTPNWWGHIHEFASLNLSQISLFITQVVEFLNRQSKGASNILYQFKLVPPELVVYFLP